MRKTKRRVVQVLGAVAFGAVVGAVSLAASPITAQASTASDGFTMERKAAIRYPIDSDTSGIRFQANLSDAYLEEKLDTALDGETLKLNGYKDDNDRFGMIIVPELYLTDENVGYNNQNGSNDYYTYFQDTLGHIIDVQFTNVEDITYEKDAYCLRGAVKSVYMQNFNLNYVGIGYFYDGENYEYAAAGDEDYFATSIVGVAERALASEYTFTTEQSSMLNEIIKDGELAEKGASQTVEGKFTYNNKTYETKEDLYAAVEEETYVQNHVQTQEGVCVTYTSDAYKGTVAGTKYTVSKAGGYIPVAEDVALVAGETIANIAFIKDYIAASTDREWTVAIVLLTDGTNNLYIKIQVPNSVFNSVNMSYSTDGSSYSTQENKVRYFTQSDPTVDARCLPFTINYTQAGGLTFFPKANDGAASVSLTDLTVPASFVTNGVDVKVCIGDLANDYTSTSFVVERDYVYLTEENASRTYNTNKCNETITGTKYTVFKTGEYITIAEDVQLQANEVVANIAFCIDDIPTADDREWHNVVVCLTDGSESIYIRLRVGSNTHELYQVYVDYSTDGVSYTSSGDIYNRSIASSDTNGMPFTITYTESGLKVFDNRTISALNIPESFVTNGVDVKICISSFVKNTSTSFIVEK